MGRPLNNLRLPQLIEKLLNILRLSLLRESTERLLYSITDEITIRSTAIFSKTMEDLTVTDSDLDMTLDYIAEDFTDAETILDDMKSALGTTIPYFINSVKRSIFLSGAPPEVHEILQEIWYRRFVSMKKKSN